MAATIRVPTSSSPDISARTVRSSGVPPGGDADLIFSASQRSIVDQLNPAPARQDARRRQFHELVDVGPWCGRLELELFVVAGAVGDLDDDALGAALGGLENDADRDGVRALLAFAYPLG